VLSAPSFLDFSLSFYIFIFTRLPALEGDSQWRAGILHLPSNKILCSKKILIKNANPAKQELRYEFLGF
jgi:hypothetical protein